ncbi:MAG: hypothetical protein DRJ07_19905 [Bacteroidetes bacterium]|nr:MAG: hypothetical protein DRJ07_19905 [Bacteroidota bacterium]
MNQNWKILLSSTLTGLFVFFYLLISETGSIRLSGRFIDYLIYFLFLANTIGFSISHLNWKIKNKTSLKDNFILWFLLILIVDGIALTSILLVFAKLFNFMYFSQLDFDVFFIRNKNLSQKINVLSTLILVVYIISDYAIYSYNKYLDFQVHGEKLAADKLRLHFEALENQLKPHYLFNNLNTVISLIYSDKITAENYVRQLAKTYRYILSCKNKKTISIQEELDFIDAYTFLMKTRYKKALFVNIKVDNHSKKGYIVPLSLQILVENAIKHNQIQEQKPLSIQIFSKADYLVVENNLNGTIDSVTINNQLITNINKVKSHKIGLQNIQKRYELISDKKVQIKKTTVFRVEIPILNE